ncbi:MAG: DUF6240 domain-containing protein [Lachnospiraceae bacterium]|nr:DUF6240 domain-containing protein [Lachnospiraceae bacterium]
MNIANAFAAYGAQQTEGPKKTLSAPNGTESTKETGFASVTEAIKYSDEQDVTAKNTSDVYSKNLNKEETEEKVEEEKTESEKNQDRLENVSERMTDKDMKQLQSEGANISEMTPEQIEAAMERIKLQNDLKAGALESQIESMEEMRVTCEKIAISNMTSSAKEELIASRLEKANLPVTANNIEKVEAALDKTGGAVKLSAEVAEYLVRNKLVPTPENLAQANSSGATYNKKEHALTDEAWAQLEPTVSHLLFQAGLRGSKEMYTAAKTFIKKDIPLTSENLKAYAQLMKLKLSEDQVLAKAVDALSVGQDPKNMNLLSSTAKEVRNIVGRVAQVTDKAVDYASVKATKENPGIAGEEIDLTLGDITDAQDKIDSGYEDVTDYLQEYANSGAAQAASIRARRQLEEVRVKMTYEAGYRLAKEGIRIDTVGMEKLLNNLRALENRFFSSFFTQAGVSASAENVELLRDTTRKLDEIKNMPATLVVDTSDMGAKISLDELYATGQNTEYRKFNATFETVMTSPRADYGDSINKAFDNTDALLAEIDVAPDETTRRAVRMLGYGNSEITKENVEKIAEYDEKLQTIFRDMHPSVTVKMIKEGINPLETSVEDLNAKIAEIRERDGISGDDNYSVFLINLMKDKAITSEERSAYIGIYRALHRIEEGEEKAVGAVFKNGQELTLQSLLTAVRSGKAVGMDKLVNDTFKNAFKVSNDRANIEDRIKAGIAKATGIDADAINKVAEDVDNKISELSKEDGNEAIERMRNLAYDSSNATMFLEDFNILTTVENIEAAKEMLSDNTTMFKEWKKFKSFEEGAEAELPDFTEALTSKEEMQAAYQAFLNTAKDLKANLRHDASMSREDVKALKHMEVGARFMNRLSKREFYQIPVNTGNDIVNMNVTILEKGVENAKVFCKIPTNTLGNVMADVTIQDNKLKCFISSDTKDGTQALRERQLNLFATLADNKLTIGSLYYGTEEVSPESYTYKTDGIYKDEQQGSENTGDSTMLYRVARALVVHVRNTDEFYLGL